MKLYPHGETPSTPRRSASPYCGISSLFEYAGPSKTMEAKAAGEAVMDAFIDEMVAARMARSKRDWLPLTSRNRLRRGK